MERRKQGNGWETFFEHWGLPLSGVIIVAFTMALTKILSFFIR